MYKSNNKNGGKLAEDAWSSFELRPACLELRRSRFATLRLVRALRSLGPALLVPTLRCARVPKNH